MEPVRALLASDGSPSAIDALRRGLAVVAPSAEVTVLTVADQMPPLAPPIGLGAVGAPNPAVVDEVLDAAAKRADALAHDTAEALGVGARTEVATGDPGDAICRVAAAGGYDVIVIGSHASGWWSRLLSSSPTEHVVRHAPCPVLVVPTDPEP